MEDTTPITVMCFGLVDSKAKKQQQQQQLFITPNSFTFYYSLQHTAIRFFGNFLRNWERKKDALPFPIRRKRIKKLRQGMKTSGPKIALNMLLSVLAGGSVWPETLGMSAWPDLSWYKTSRLQQQCAQLWGGSGGVPGIRATSKNHTGQPCWTWHSFQLGDLHSMAHSSG